MFVSPHIDLHARQIMAISSTALREGEALLAAGTVSQNHDLFRCDAIDACIDRGRWDAAVDHAEALDDSTRREPSPFSTFLVARAHALVA